MNAPVPADIVAFARAIYDVLRIGRDRGVITPNKPIHGEEIVQRYNTKYGADYEVPVVRRAVHYLRAELGLPIGSSGNGYFLCTTEAEWRETADRLRERVRSQVAAIQKPSIRFGEKSQLVLAIRKEFDAIEVAP